MSGGWLISNMMHGISMDLQKAHIWNIVCEESMARGWCTSFFAFEKSSKSRIKLKFNVLPAFNLDEWNPQALLRTNCGNYSCTWATAALVPGDWSDWKLLFVCLHARRVLLHFVVTWLTCHFYDKQRILFIFSSTCQLLLIRHIQQSQRRETSLSDITSRTVHVVFIESVDIQLREVHVL